MIFHNEGSISSVEIGLIGRAKRQADLESKEIVHIENPMDGQ